MDERQATGAAANCNRSKQQGFTLVEVLIALAMAALGFGVVLHSVGLQMSLVSGCLDRHQMLLYGSQVIETQMAAGVSSEKIVDETLAVAPTSDSTELEPTQFVYGVDSQPVTADPRMQQVNVTVKNGRHQIRLSAYRVRIRRNDEEGGT